MMCLTLVATLEENEFDPFADPHPGAKSGPSTAQPSPGGAQSAPDQRDDVVMGTEGDDFEKWLEKDQNPSQSDDDDFDPEKMARAFDTTAAAAGGKTAAEAGPTSSSSSTLMMAEGDEDNMGMYSYDGHLMKLTKQIMVKMTLPMAKCKKLPAEGDKESGEDGEDDDEDSFMRDFKS